MNLVASTAATVVRAGSRLRGERVIHAKGRTFTGAVRLTGGAGLGVPLLDEAGEHPALLRLSRSVGLPDALPDVLGLAVRVLDAHGPGRHQDLVLATGTGSPLARHLPLPARQVLRSTYTSLLPYDLGGHRLLVAALPVADAPAATSVEAVRGADLRFRLAVGGSTDGWHEIGVLQATGLAEDGREVRFSPFTTGGGIAPAGRLQELRRRSYEAAHVGPDA